MAFGLKKQKRPAEPAVVWPEVNGLVWLRLPCCDAAVHPSRVEGTDGPNLVVAEPSRPHREAVPPPSEDKLVMLGWRNGASSMQMRIEFVERREGEVPTWVVRALTQAELIQRRRFVRASWDRDVTMHLLAGDVTGKILDISEGGMRCEIPAMPEPRSPYFDISFELDNRAETAKAEVAWWAEPSGDTVQVGLQFVPGQKALGDRLRSHAYALQLEERRKSLD